ncbi:MAG: BlaI/MecI/CopY family transcriptional regulator [Actinobacteria bacterium]|nr:BlaI/MecI/CopY family transcriptional regulator [Actinomycetota bacterium]
MADLSPIQGELQAQIMAALWRLEAGTVEQVRSALPTRYQSAYTTVQTVLNRLAERGFLTRRRAGQAIVYRPTLTEAQYLSRTIQQTLASATAGARQAALAQLISGLADSERADLKRLTDEVDAARKAKRR